MAARSNSPEKLTKLFSFRVSDLHDRALQQLGRLHGMSAAELLRTFIDREWSERAEDLKKIEETITKARKKKAA